MKKALVLCCLICLQLVAFAKSSDHISNLWNEANRAYQNKQYEMAIDQYEAILAAEKVDAEVFFNLGNAYFKNEQNGKAIANYLKALQLNPEFKAAQDNLKFVQSKSDNGFDANKKWWIAKWFHAVVNVFSANVWAWMALGLSIATSFLFLKNRIKQKPRANNKLLVAVCLLAFTFSIVAHQSKTIQNKAVVLQGNTFLYDNAQKSKVKWNLTEGTVLNIKKTENTLLEVSLDNGIQGWVNIEDVEKL